MRYSRFNKKQPKTNNKYFSITQMNLCFVQYFVENYRCYLLYMYAKYSLFVSESISFKNFITENFVNNHILDFIMKQPLSFIFILKITCKVTVFTIKNIVWWFSTSFSILIILIKLWPLNFPLMEKSNPTILKKKNAGQL